MFDIVISTFSQCSIYKSNFPITLCNHSVFQQLFVIYFRLYEEKHLQHIFLDRQNDKVIVNSHTYKWRSGYVNLTILIFLLVELTSIEKLLQHLSMNILSSPPFHIFMANIEGHDSAIVFDNKNIQGDACQCVETRTWDSNQRGFNTIHKERVLGVAFARAIFQH